MSCLPIAGYNLDIRVCHVSVCAWSGGLGEQAVNPFAANPLPPTSLKDLSCWILSHMDFEETSKTNARVSLMSVLQYIQIVVIILNSSQRRLWK